MFLYLNYTHVIHHIYISVSGVLNKQYAKLHQFSISYIYVFDFNHTFKSLRYKSVLFMFNLTYFYFINYFFAKFVFNWKYK